MRTVGIVTAGHLATCPRMLKAAEAFTEAGYDVRVVATRSTPWASQADEELLEKRRGLWQVTTIDYRRSSSPWTYLRTGARQRLARWLARLPGPPLAVATRAFARTHDELVRAAVATGAELLYGGTTGGIAATAEAARRLGVPYALDLEDFYSGQSEEGTLDDQLARGIEEAVLPGASFLTAGSEAIAEAYRTELGVDPVPIHNTFPLPEEPPELEGRPEERLRLYWFSQTVGPGRGLEEAVVALGLARVAVELHVRGSVLPGYDASLEALASREAPALALRWHPPASPDDMVALARDFDVGLALEQGASRNNRLALGNKVLTYLVAGLALAATEIDGHQPVLRSLGEHAVVAPPGDSETIAKGLERLASDRDFLRACREASFEAALRRWHWEHPDELGRLQSLLREALP